MKKIIITLSAFFITLLIQAQAPQLLNYQAVARNNSSQPLTNQSIGLRFSILQSSVAGTTLYQETQTTTTNAAGLFTVSIGGGSVTIGTMTGIDWKSGTKFLKVEIDPAGGTSYSLTGTTQLLSVPYALYAEKTNLIAGNGISITNGNTIVNTQNPWLLTGNTGTNSANNFLGTTDDQTLYLRTNNINRISVDKATVSPSGNIGLVRISDMDKIETNPGELAIWGRDINGYALPFHLFQSVNNLTWGTSANSTLGRFFRMSQFRTDPTNYIYIDQGISQDSSYYISQLALSASGTVLPKKMFTISMQNNVGINLATSEKPTANFHTKGTLRHEGLTTNNNYNNIFVADASGNVFLRDLSSINYWAIDVNGINYSSNAGIGAQSKIDTRLTVLGTGNFAAEFNSNYDWQTAVNIFNNTNNYKWSFVLGGAANNFTNYGVGNGNFGIVNGNTTGSNTSFPILITKDDKVGIGMGPGGSDNFPKSRLQVKDGDVFIDKIGSGVIMKSPNGQCWRMTVSDAGAPVFTAITCPN